MTFAEFYLLVFLFWVQLATGVLSLRCIHGLTGGDWGRDLPRIRWGFFAILLLAFIPIIFMAPELFPWIRQPSKHAHLYLNLPFFIARGFIYLSFWLALSVWLQGKAHSVKNGYLYAWGMVGLVVTISLASVDWIMSREFPWYSTMFGVMFFAGALVLGLAYTLLVKRSLEFKSNEVDQASILMALVMAWAYVNFMQYLIIWSGNLPHEVVWYLKRIQNGWGVLVLPFALLSFFLPFSLLLFRKLKRNTKFMAGLGALVILGLFIELIWVVLPASQENLVWSPWQLGFMILVLAPLAAARRLV